MRLTIGKVLAVLLAVVLVFTSAAPTVGSGIERVATIVPLKIRDVSPDWKMLYPIAPVLNFSVSVSVLPLTTTLDGPPPLPFEVPLFVRLVSTPLLP